MYYKHIQHATNEGLHQRLYRAQGHPSPPSSVQHALIKWPQGLYVQVRNLTTRGWYPLPTISAASGRNDYHVPTCIFHSDVPRKNTQWTNGAIWCNVHEYKHCILIVNTCSHVQWYRLVYGKYEAGNSVLMDCPKRVIAYFVCFSPRPVSQKWRTFLIFSLILPVNIIVPYCPESPSHLPSATYRYSKPVEVTRPLIIALLS